MQQPCSLIARSLTFLFPPFPTQAPFVSNAHGVARMPMFLLFTPGSRVGVPYTGPPQLPQLVDHLNAAAGTHRTPGGRLTHAAGRVPQLDRLVLGFFSLDLSVQTRILQDVKALRRQLPRPSRMLAGVYVDVMTEALQAPAHGQAVHTWLVSELQTLTAELEDLHGRDRPPTGLTVYTTRRRNVVEVLTGVNPVK